MDKVLLHARCSIIKIVHGRFIWTLSYQQLSYAIVLNIASHRRHNKCLVTSDTFSVYRFIIVIFNIPNFHGSCKIMTNSQAIFIANEPEILSIITVQCPYNGHSWYCDNIRSFFAFVGLYPRKKA